MPDPFELIELQRRIALYDDETAYRQLYYLFYKPLLHFTGAFISSPEVCEEIVSDVFIKIWQNRKHIDNIRNIKIYLYVSAKNNTLRYLQGQQRLSIIGLDELGVEVQTSAQDPEQMMITAEMMNRLEKAIDSLPPRCKIVYKLIREDRLRYKEISQILDISIKTIDNHLAIALKKIAGAIRFNLSPVSSTLPPAKEL